MASVSRQEIIYQSGAPEAPNDVAVRPAELSETLTATSPAGLGDPVDVHTEEDTPTVAASDTLQSLRVDETAESSSQRGVSVADLLAAYSDLFPELQRYAGRMLSSSHQGEDIAQEAITRAWKSLADGRTVSRSHFRGWMHTIVTHLAIDTLRKPPDLPPRSLSDPMGDSGGTLGAILPDPAQDFTEIIDTHDLLMQALSVLEPKARLRLWLKHAHGYSLKELAQASGMTVRAVDSELTRSRQAVRMYLENSASNQQPSS